MAAELGAKLEQTLEKIKNKRYQLMMKMDDDTQLLASVKAKIEVRQERANKVNERMTRRRAAKKEYEKTIMETEAAYKKILESSALLLKSLQDQAAMNEDETQLLGENAGDLQGQAAADQGKTAE